MKKFFLMCFTCCLLLAGVSAQDTVFTAQKKLSGVNMVDVSGNARLHIVYGYDSNIILTVTSQSPLKEEEAFNVFTRKELNYHKISHNKGTSRNKTEIKVLELFADGVEYELKLNKEQLILHGEENSSITYSSLVEDLQSLSVNLEDRSCFRFMPSEQVKKYNLSNLSLKMEDSALFYENMPLEIKALVIYTSDNSRYFGYDDSDTTIIEEIVVSEDDVLIVSDSVVEQTSFRKSWNELGDLFEDIINNEYTTRSRPNYWYNKWELYWGFLGWQFVVPTYHLMYPYDESPDLHVSFSSFTWEIKECYRFKYRHELTFGLGVSWDNYRLPTPTNNSLTNILGDSLNSTFQKGKVRVGYVQLPIGYGFQRKNGGFNFALEVIPGYVMNAIQKSTWESSESKYLFKQGIKDKVEPWKLDARLTLGWSWGSIYVQPSLLPVVDSNGDKLYPIRAGFRIKL